MLVEPILAEPTTGFPVPDDVPDQRRRWVVLSCTAVSSAINCFMWMSYSGTPDTSKVVLGSPSEPISDEDLDWTYSASLSAVCVLMMPAAYLIEWHNYGIMLSSVCLNMAAAWLRYASVACASYGLAILSAILLGGATAVIMPAFAHLPAVWFPPHERAFATALSVQSWYAGWALGALIIPLVVSDAASMKDTMLAQAAVTSLSLPLFLGLYVAEPPATTTAPKLSSTSSPQPAEHLHAASDTKSHLAASVGDSLYAISRNGQFWVHALSYGLLAGVSFTIPAITANSLSAKADCMQPALPYVADQTMWLNFGFITSGVVGGVLLGSLSTEPQEPLIIRLSAGLCAATLTILFVVTRPPLLRAIGDGPLLLAILVVLLSGAGASSLGFFSLGLRSAARVGEPVSHVYTAGLTEMLSQLLAVSLTQSSVCPVGFKACALSSIVVAVALVSAARFPRHGQPLARVDSAAAPHTRPALILKLPSSEARYVHIRPTVRSCLNVVILWNWGAACVEGRCRAASRLQGI